MCLILSTYFSSDKRFERTFDCLLHLSSALLVLKDFNHDLPVPVDVEVVECVLGAYSIAVLHEAHGRRVDLQVGDKD